MPDPRHIQQSSSWCICAAWF